MPEKAKRYEGVKFQPNVIKAAHQVFLEYIPEAERVRFLTATDRSTRTGAESWTFDKDEEFFAEYRKEVGSASISFYPADASATMTVSFAGYMSSISVRLPEKHQVESVFEVFEDAVEVSKMPQPGNELPPPPKPRIFIGHGHSPLWRELADYIETLQAFDTAAYEVGPRAGLSVKEVLQRLLREASFAILVHTAEDEQGDGGFRARENVVHETGLFQGKLGFERVTVLREEGCESFSNQSGINEIRFSQGNIRETYGEVVSTLFREFPVQQ